jgi:DNA polymerase/3'-5' exonuclease PolX
MATSDFKALILENLATMETGARHDKTDPQHAFKALAYKKAIEAIRPLASVASVDDVKGLKGVGDKIIKKIEEILATGSLKAATKVEERLDLKTLAVLEGIHGIGPVRAKSLVEAGLTTIELLRAAVASNPKLLTKAQQLGLRHYEAGLQRIPRAEMREHEVRLQALWEAHGLVGILVGSYRRGAADSGDIDVLLRGGFDAEVRFAALVASLGGYIVGSLTAGKTKWMGYVQLPGGVVRRLDLMLTPPAEYAFAILYFTGSDKFNVAFRSHCLSLGYTLNEHALTIKPTTVVTASGGAGAAASTVPSAKPVPLLEKEEDIFAFVGLRYVPPTERVDSKQIVRI